MSRTAMQSEQPCRSRCASQPRMRPRPPLPRAARSLDVGSEMDRVLSILQSVDVRGDGRRMHAACHAEQHASDDATLAVANARLAVPPAADHWAHVSVQTPTCGMPRRRASMRAQPLFSSTHQHGCSEPERIVPSRSVSLDDVDAESGWHNLRQSMHSSASHLASLSSNPDVPHPAHPQQERHRTAWDACSSVTSWCPESSRLKASLGLVPGRHQCDAARSHVLARARRRPRSAPKAGTLGARCTADATQQWRAALTPAIGAALRPSRHRACGHPTGGLTKARTTAARPAWQD